MRVVSWILPVMLIALSGCESKTVVHVPEPSSDEPMLYHYFIVDSFGVSSEFDESVELEIDPFVDDGIFEVYWDVESYRDYRVTLSVNNDDDLLGGAFLSTEVCGPSHSCDYTGLQMCQYFPDYTMGCGYDLHEAELNRVSVDHLVITEPETLYINIDVCNLDETWCESDSIPVLAW